MPTPITNVRLLKVLLLALRRPCGVWLVSQEIYRLGAPSVLLVPFPVLADELCLPRQRRGGITRRRIGDLDPHLPSALFPQGSLHLALADHLELHFALSLNRRLLGLEPLAFERQRAGRG